MDYLQIILNDLPASDDNDTTDPSQQPAHAENFDVGKPTQVINQFVDQRQSDEGEPLEALSISSDTTVNSEETAGTPNDIATVEDDYFDYYTTIIRPEQKGVLFKCPNEILWQIVEELDPVSSFCLSLTANIFREMHWPVHGHVDLHARCEEVELCELINAFMEAGGWTYLVEYQEINGRWARVFCSYKEYFPGYLLRLSGWTPAYMIGIRFGIHVMMTFGLFRLEWMEGQMIIRGAAGMIMENG